jgi:hypothetical protein
MFTTRFLSDLLAPSEHLKPALLQRRVLLFQLVHSLVERTGVELSGAARQMLAQRSPLGHDAGVARGVESVVVKKVNDSSSSDNDKDNDSVDG